MKMKNILNSLFPWLAMTTLLSLQGCENEEGTAIHSRDTVSFEIDETGKPLSVYFKVSKEANKLIEEFMLLANKTVAVYVGKVPKNIKPKVLPYRIHDLPDPDKLDNLNQLTEIHAFICNVIEYCLIAHLPKRSPTNQSFP